MKLLTITIPCYNSQDYMDKAIQCAVKGGERVEVIIVNDGSKDRTGEIADSYALQYPDIVKVIHQDNGGHGEGINQGVKNATGTYFITLDSDDWFDEEVYQKLLNKLEELEAQGGVDTVICGYTYVHDNKKLDKKVLYRNVFPKDKIYTWQETKKFSIHQCLTIHTNILRTQVIRDSKLVLPKHMFYEDNILIYLTLPYCKRLYYINESFYQYYIGRADQSVNEEVWKKRCLQQKKAALIIITSNNLTELRKTEPKLARYMEHECDLLLSIATVGIRLNDTPEMVKENEDMWKEVIEFDPIVGKRLKNRSACFWVTRKGRFGRWLAIKTYRLAQKVMRLN